MILYEPFTDVPNNIFQFIGTAIAVTFIILVLLRLKKDLK